MGIENPTHRENTDKKEEFNISSSHRTEIVPKIIYIKPIGSIPT